MVGSLRVSLGRALRLLAGVGLLVACSPPKAPVAPRTPTPPNLPWQTEPATMPEVRSAPVAIVGATLMTGTGEQFEDAAITFGDGRIIAVGPRASVPLPADALVVDAKGRFVTPGLIDAHSHMGVYAVRELTANADGNEATRPVTANVRAADGFWPQDPALSHALAAGITTVLVLPGSANLVGGQGVTLKLHPGRSVADMQFPGAPRTLKMACGENPKRVYGERRTSPSTRMGNVAGYREAFQGALEYGAKFSDWQARHQAWQRKQEPGKQELGKQEPGKQEPGKQEPGKQEPGKQEPAAAPAEPPPAMPARDFGLETLLGALQGRVLVEVHCYRADEMLGMLALADEFGLTVRAFHHAIEAYKIRDVLAARQVAVATWADWWGFKLEAYDTVRENLALLAEAGVRGIVHSDSANLIQRLNQEAAKSLGAGKRAGVPIDRGVALRWITSNPAWALGVENQTGSLEPGKMADVVLWSGDPFSVYSKVDRVYVDGQELYDRNVAGRRPSDFELGQGAELPQLEREKRAPPTAVSPPVAPPSIPATPAGNTVNPAAGGDTPAPGLPPNPAPANPAPANPAPASPAPPDKAAPAAPNGPPPALPPAAKERRSEARP